jgi:hypothetical protein
MGIAGRCGALQKHVDKRRFSQKNKREQLEIFVIGFKFMSGKINTMKILIYPFQHLEAEPRTQRATGGGK